MNDSIKMFIAGEEVVCSNEFEIDEEMLSASSTILNNCYPKSWELTKDYISNFYFPKDYSRFVLAQGKYEKGLTEFTSIETSGKNLLYMSSVYSIFNGITIKSNSDGSLHIYGTATATGSIQIPLAKDILLGSGKYVFSGKVVGALDDNKCSIRLQTADDVSFANDYRTIIGNATRSLSSSSDEGKTFTKVLFFALSGTVLDIVLYYQLEKGNAVTDFEPYGEDIVFETNVEKRFDNFNVYGNIYQQERSGKNLIKNSIGFGDMSGFTYSSTLSNDVYKNCKVRKFDNTSQSSGFNSFCQWASIRTNLGIDFKANEIYTFSFWVKGTAPNTMVCYFYGLTGYAKAKVIASSNGYTGTWGDGAWTFNGLVTNEWQRVYVVWQIENASASTIAVDKTILIRQYYGNNVQICGCMFEKGQTLGNDYEPYGIQPSPNFQSDLIGVGYRNLIKNTDVYSAEDFNYWNSYSTFDKETRTLTRSTTSTSESYIQHRLNGIKSGTTYTISFYAKSNGYVKGMDIYIFNINTQGIKYRAINNVPTEFKKFVFTFTTADDVDYSIDTRIRIDNNGSTTSGVEATLTIKDVCMVESDKACEYVDYSKYGIQISNSSKNMFILPDSEAKNGITYTKNEDGTFDIKGTASAKTEFTIWKLSSELDFLKTGKKLTLSSNIPGQNVYFQIATWNGQQIQPSWVNTLVDANSNRIFTVSQTTFGWLTRFNIYVNSGQTVNFENVKLQLEEGTAKTEFYPQIVNNYVYELDEPLRGVKNKKDKLYIENNLLCVERNIGVLELTGDKGWTYEYATGAGWAGPRYTIYNIDTEYSVATNPINALCDYVKFTPNPANYLQYDETFTFRYIAGQKTRVDIVSNTMGVSSVNDFKTWLNTNKPIINYVLPAIKFEVLGVLPIPKTFEYKNYIHLEAGIETAIDLKYYWKNYDVLFAGVVKNSGDISLNPRHPHYCSLQILDYKTFLSESNTLDFVIADKTVKEAIEMVVNAVSGYGFIVGEIDIDSANDVIGAYSTLNKTAYDVLQYLAEISGSRWRTRVIDSLTMAIDFYDPDNLPQAEDIEYTKEYWENNNIVDMTFNYGTRDYRNKQLLLSDEVYANINYDETVISDGYGNSFTLQNNIGDIVSIIVDGAEKTIGTNNDKQMGVEADFYFTPGKNIVESNSVYSAGTLIHLTYQPLVKGRQIVYNNSEVERIKLQTQTEGVIARYETRNDVLSSDELEKIAKTYIEYKGKAEVIITVKTQNKDLYKIGEVVYFNAPIEDLAQDYMVKSKKTEYVVINDIINLFYIYEMTSSFNSEKAINYFDNQRNKASGNIQEGDSITRNVDIETQANIVWSEGSVSSASVTVTGDNVLNCALNSPFVE